MNSSRPSARPSHGFTLLEVMIAVVIFSISLAALFVTFRTGITAWRLSHQSTETFQSAQQAQEVVMSDLARCFFMPERLYNLTFNAQLQQLENYESVHREAAGLDEADRASFTASVQDPGISPESLAVPVNLKFAGKDGGELDEIEFARHQSPWLARSDFTWGVKRVRYFVKDEVLYREEKEPFGLPGGQTIANFVSARFGQDDSSVLNAQSSTSRTTFTEEEMERFEASAPVVEPLCDGVTLFNITYGYYRKGHWVEVKDWDSSEFRYRFPEDELEGTLSLNGGVGNLPAAGGTQVESGFTPQASFGMQYEQRVALIGGEAVNFQVEQDDLPAYCAIQLGVKEPGEKDKGRTRSFTFFVSLSEAQEHIDPTMLDSMEDSGFRMPGQ